MKDNLIITLISLGVGALLGGVVQAVVGRYAAFKESKGMAVALRAEINAIIEIVQYRQYLVELARIIQRLQNPAYQPTYLDVFSVKVQENYFETFNSLCSKIGMLDSISHSIVLFYTQGKAVLEDFHRLYEIHELAWAGKIVLARQGLLDMTQGLHSILQLALATGTQASQDLDRYTARRWVGLFQ